jgi:hypothetical protein
MSSSEHTVEKVCASVEDGTCQKAQATAGVASRWRCLLIFGGLAVPLMILGVFVLTDLMAAKRAQESLQVEMEHAFVDVKSDVVQIDLSASVSGFNVGIASKIQPKTITCELNIPCPSSNSATMQVSGALHMNGNAMNAELYARSKAGWKCLRATLMISSSPKPGIGGTCTVDAEFQLLSILPFSVTVERSFSDLYTTSTQSADESLKPKPESGLVSTQSETCKPQLASSESNVTFQWCLDLAPLLQTLDVKVIGLRIPSTELLLSAPRTDGAWLVRTLPVEVQNLHGTPVIIGGSATFTGLVDSPLTAGFVELLWYGNLSLAVNAIYKDIIGQMAESRFDIGAASQDRHLNDGPYFAKAANEIYEFFYNINAEPLKTMLSEAYDLGERLSSDLGGGAYGDSVASYVLDKLSNIFTPPRSAFCTDCSSFKTVSVTTPDIIANQMRHQIVIKQGTQQNHFTVDLKTSVVDLSRARYDDLDNGYASGNVQVSKAVSDWLQVAPSLRDADGGVSILLNLTNKNGVGNATMRANNLDVVALSWSYTHQYREAEDLGNCPDRVVSGPYGMSIFRSEPLKWHRANFNLGVRLLGTTQVNFVGAGIRATNIPFIEYGALRDMSMDSLTITDVVGETVLTYRVTSSDLRRCPPKSYTTYDTQPPIFRRPNKAAMQSAATTTTATVKNQGKVSVNSANSNARLLTLLFPLFFCI